MNQLIQSKNLRSLIVLAATLVCIWLLPRAQAVVPPPDGGYAGGNTAEGTNALLSLSSGTYNTAVGAFSLLSNTVGNLNTGVGAGALLSSGAANRNTATGAGALLSATGGANTANGAFALFANTIGTNNTAIGNNALILNQTGNGNIALGPDAGANLTTGDGNIYIGNPGVASEGGTIRIGNSNSGPTFIGGITGAAVVGDPVVVDANGQLGTATSSARFKKEIKPMDKASEAILALKPVSFQYKSDSKGTPQFGLIAEEVAKVNPDLVVRDRKGEIYSVRYDQVNAMLLNEFLKAHLRMEEQDKRIEELTAQLKEQAAQIQKVSAQLEASEPAPQVVNNNQ
jgi:endosialidase-like protein